MAANFFAPQPTLKAAGDSLNVLLAHLTAASNGGRLFFTVQPKAVWVDERDKKRGTENPNGI